MVIMFDSLIFIASLVFLIGVLMVVASAFPKVRERFPGLMGYGFLLSVLGIAAAMVIAFLIP